MSYSDRKAQGISSSGTTTGAASSSAQNGSECVIRSTRYALSVLREAVAQQVILNRFFDGATDAPAPCWTYRGHCNGAAHPRLAAPRALREQDNSCVAVVGADHVVAGPICRACRRILQWKICRVSQRRTTSSHATRLYCTPVGSPYYWTSGISFSSSLRVR